MEEISVKIKNKFDNIERELNKELIGQQDFTKQICGYYENKLINQEKGTIFLIGEKETAKKTIIRKTFNYLKDLSIVENTTVNEIDLASYNFNLGFNVFITDLYEKLSDNSACLLFKNTEKASEEMLSVLSNIYPNTCLNLKDSYIIKNKILVKSNLNDKNIIDEIICNNKFIVYTTNDENYEIGAHFTKDFTSSVDKVFYTKPLTSKERNEMVKRGVLEIIKNIENQNKVKIVLDIDEDEKNKDYFGVCSYLQETYKKSSSFGISEYVYYKLSKPLNNLILKEDIKENTTIFINVDNEGIHCKINNEQYLLSEYSIVTLEEAEYKLNSIIGIKDLKEFLLNVKNNYNVQNIRKKLGLTVSNVSLNMIFAGNAGTGKTNAARITFEYLNALDILSKGIYKEVSKADFVSENPSETAKKTIEIINSAIGGVLFIDEAYSLCESEDDKIGKEIIDALLKGIEDNRDDLVVILAGYEKDMEEFLSFNPGLKSRFSNTIHFSDYSPYEMYEIAINIAKSKGYRISKNVKNELIELFVKNQISGKNDLGNARFVRNIVENAILDASKKYLDDNTKEIDLLERDNFNFKAKTKFDLEEKLGKIVGLNEVKSLLRNQYKLIIAQEKRKASGVDTKIEQNLNMVFAGNPGTGKTSIARLVSEMLNSMGLLKVGQLIETDRSSFISQVPGETSKKTEEKFKEAIGGVLFIDEAYTLANDSLGREATETLLKLIEDYSKEVVVILAGYEEEMEDFFDVNIGLKSRFPIWTTFEDYNPNELLEMSINLIESRGFKLSKNAYTALKKSFEDIYEESDATSGNGRMVRNYVENLIRNQSIRISSENISAYEMNLITTKDIEKIKVSEYEFDLEQRLKTLKCNEKAKEFLRNEYKFIKIQEKRAKFQKKNNINKYSNIVFTGNIGTGKKSILNILAEMYFSKDIIKSKNIVEMDIREIINNSSQIDNILEKSLGKIVLIDKAHLLLGVDNYKEILANLIKFIDNNKNKIKIVLSGQKEKMKELVFYNESLKYRFPVWLDFEDYKEEELYEICLDMLESKEFSLDKEVKDILKTVINKLNNKTHITLKNSLMIKGYIDKLVRVQSIRIYDLEISYKELNHITKEDILKAEKIFMKENTLETDIEEVAMTKDIVTYESKILDKEDIYDKLLKIKNLYDLDIIDEEEFKYLKKKIIK